MKTLKVPLESKWYHFELHHEDGTVELLDFGVLDDCQPVDPKCFPAYVDHVPNPFRVDLICQHNGWYLDDLSLDLIVGRWEIEVKDYI